jgi:hypothetical protein
MSTLGSERSVFSAESYFGTQLPPPTLENDVAGVRAFVGRQRDLGSKVVLVTVSVARPLALPSVGSNVTSLLSQERRDDRPVGAQRVSASLSPLACRLDG